MNTFTLGTASLFLALLLTAGTACGEGSSITQQTPSSHNEDSQAGLPTAYQREIAAWHKARTERLTAPEGWLTLVALEWLKPGENTVGSASDCSIRLDKAPAHLGSMFLDPATGKVTARFNRQASVSLDNSPAPDALIPLADDNSEKPTFVRFGSSTLIVIRRGERLGIRVKDTEAPARRLFTGIPCFPVDPTWKIEARWVPFTPPRQLTITNVLGQTATESAPGKAVFERGGVTYELIPTQDAPGEELFFVLRDATSGDETYGASRFLSSPPPKDGKVLLDFNKAYNPPCAFTPHATCPLPIPENRLSLPIRAGEKTYEGGPAH